MKNILLSLVVIMTIFTPQACAQRRIVSDYNYQKAVDAFYDEDDDDKALDLLNKQIKGFQISSR